MEKITRCAYCADYYEDELVQIENTWHTLVYCCDMCLRENTIRCPKCDTRYLPWWGKDSYIQICRKCEAPSPEVLAEAERLYQMERREAPKVCTQVNRTVLLHLPSTLTAKQWSATLRDFNHKCAYCLAAPYEHLDHFIPVSQGGGTTKLNCVPACKACNRAKGYKHPKKCTFIAEGELYRVFCYLCDKSLKSSFFWKNANEIVKLWLKRFPESLIRSRSVVSYQFGRLKLDNISLK